MPRSSSTKQKTLAKQGATRLSPAPSYLEARATLHQGPIPPPEVLRDYDQIVAGAAERIIVMAEKQASHRQDLEKQSQGADIAARDRQLEIEQRCVMGTIRNERIGQILGGLVALACVAAAAWGLINKVSPVSIALFLGLPVAGIIKAFLPNRHSRQSRE